MKVPKNMDKPVKIFSQDTASSHEAEQTRQEAARWQQETYGPAIARKAERRSFVTDVGIKVKPLYTPADLADAGFDYASDLGFPGEFPYTRGDRPAMCRNEPFVMSAYSGFGEASQSNKRFKKLIEWGTEHLMLALDLPTQCGYDADHPMSIGEVGKCGVAMSSLADLEVMFDGIAIEKIKRVGTLANSIGPVALALFAALGEKRGLKPSEFTVVMQNDPLHEYIARGTQILPAAPAAQLAMDAVEWCVEHAPTWAPLTICANHINASGAGSIRANAIALANAIHYIELLLARGHSIDEVAPLMHMFVDERHDFFVAISLLRALRRIWARTMKNRFGATRPEAMALQTTVYGRGHQETIQEPLNNIARIAYGTLGYVLGGASYVYIASYDEAVSTPSEQSIQVGMRTQAIIANEHGFTDTIDPLGGSYFIESMTAQVESQLLAALEEVEAAGGALRVIDGGLGRRWIHEGALRRQRAIESGERPWVTVNMWPQEPNMPNSAFRIDPETTRLQLERLASVKATRDAQRVQRALDAIDEACRSGANVMPATLEAARAYATVGEISERLRKFHGVFTPNTEF